MKKRTHLAAQELGIHPANLILYLSMLGAPFEDCWPEVDDGWLQTLRQTYRDIFNIEAEKVSNLAEKDISSKAKSWMFSKSALKILDKLHRKRHWGKHTISWRTLHNDYCPSVPDLKNAVQELQESNLLLGSSVDDALSLNPSKTKEIEDLINEFRNSSH